jgi:hypothetical protein
MANNWCKSTDRWRICWGDDELGRGRVERARVGRRITGDSFIILVLWRDIPAPGFHGYIFEGVVVAEMAPVA